MKVKPNTVLIVLALLAYWFGLCNASAFYDPGMQRWLNRDPFQDYAVFRRIERATWEEMQFLSSEGLRNPYQFAHNRPISGVDIDGLCFWGGIFRPIWEGFKHNPLHPFNGMMGNCASAVAGAAAIINGNRLLEWTGSSFGFPVANDDDRLQHCITSCKIARACGSLNAAVLGDIKELSDRAWGGSADDSRGDQAANKHGRAGTCDNRTCEDYCNDTRSQYPSASGN